MRRRFLPFTLLLASAYPQTPAAPAPSYDISTIKLTDDALNHGRISISNDDSRLTTIGTTPRILLQTAFDIPRDLIFGLPKWAEDTRYDLTAKDSTTDPGVLKALPPAAVHKMLQDLLAQRFGLQFHMETREVTAYDLTFLHPAPGVKTVDHEVGSMGVNNTHMTAHGVSMLELCRRLGDELHRPVVDHTNLKGFYDIDLRWRRDDEAATNAAANDPDAPPILFTAIEEQLGLRLHSGKQTVPVLVVDRISPPTPD